MSRVNDRKNALKKLKEIDDNKKDYLVIHYSSESFVGLEGRSPRISSIAIENLEYGQSTLFAIYKTAETMGFTTQEIQEHYHEIEKSMLQDYFDYVNKNEQKIWLHWNMRDSIYGFKALEHRFQVLEGAPIIIKDSNQMNIALLFKELYGSEYIDDPKMVSLMNKNNLHPKNFLSGKEEAEAFENNHFYDLSMSTAGKVRMFSQMVNLAVDKQLKTNTSNWTLYGFGIKSLWYSLKEKPYFVPISWVVTTILGGIITKFLGL